MKTKYLLTALAVPAIFAACSQDEFADYGQVQNPAALGSVAGDVAFTINSAESRLNWDTKAPLGPNSWEGTDKFSLYWIANKKTGATDPFANVEEFPGKTNAVYFVDNNIFTSRSVVYEGKNVIVFPANTEHTSDGNIVVSVDSVQQESVKLGDRSVFVSEVLTIMAPKASGEYLGDTIPAAGYEKPVEAAVKPLSSNLVLNLNVDMGDKISEVEIEEVTLEAPANIFATKANLKLKASDSTLVKAYAVANTLSKTVKLELNNAKVTKNGPTKTVQLAIMPDSTAMKNLYNSWNSKTAQQYSIKVKTNYGVVSVDSAMLVQNSGKTAYMCGKDTTVNVGVVGNSKLNLTPELWYASQFNPTEHRGAEIELAPAQQGYGKRITLNVTVNMKDASIDDMEIKDSPALERAYTTYTLLEKQNSSNDSVNFVLAPEFAENFTGIKAFDLTPNALKAIQGNDKVTLTIKKGAATAIRLSGAHTTAIPTLPIKFAPSGSAETEMTADDFNAAYATEAALILGSEATAWAIDVNNAKILNGWSSVINEGALTLTQTETDEDKDEEALSVELINDGTIKLGSELVTIKDFANTADGIINIEQGKKFQFGKNITEGIDGTIKVAEGGKLSVAADINITTDAKIDNLGTVSAEKGNGGLTNNDTINILSNDAITYLQANNGVINLKARDNEVVVAGEKGKIVYNYVYATDGAQFKRIESDKFTYVVFDNAAKEITLHDDSSADATAKNIDDISLEFLGTTKLVTKGHYVHDVVVKKGAEVKVLSSNSLICHNMENNGTLTLGGNIWYTGEYTGNGVVDCTGDGAINKSNLEQAKLQNAITAALQNTESTEPIEVSVEEDIVLDSPLLFDGIEEIVPDVTARSAETPATPAIKKITLDLNGKTIKSAGDAIVVSTGYELTITGNGIVIAGTTKAANVAVWADGGNVIIENGTFTVGVDANNKCNDCIYAKGGTITINGGSFSHEGKDISQGGAVVNAHNSITNSKVIVNGGEFSGFQVKEEADVNANRVEWNID